MPQYDRNILKSLMATARGLLRTPPASSGISAYSVYAEKDLQAINAGAALPTRPFVFLMDAWMRPQNPGALPIVVVEVVQVVQKPFELGNRKGRTSDAILHCFGRQRGERDDLASFFTDNLGATFPVYAYTSGSAGDSAAVFQENAEIQPGITIRSNSRQTQEIRREGGLDLWSMVMFRFMTKA